MAKTTPTTDTSLVKYGDFSADDAEEEAKERESERGSGAFIKLKPGKTTLRVIPPLPGKKWKRVIYVHYVDVPGAGRVSFNCPNLCAKLHCIVCAKQKQLEASGNEIDEKKARKLRPKRRCLVPAVDRADESAGPRVFGFGTMIEDQLIELRKDEDIGGNFVDPVNGFDLAIIRTGTGENDTEYKVMPANKGRACKLSEDAVLFNQWIASQPNLDKWCKVLPADDIEKLLRGEKIERSGSDKPAAKTGRSVADQMSRDDDD